MIGLAGCATVGPDFEGPATGLPDRWPGDPGRASNDTDSVAIDARWWEAFSDPALSSLVERVAAANLDVEVAATRWMQARAARRAIAAEAELSVGGSGSYLRARGSRNGLVDISGLGGKKDYSVWQFGFDASWELDLVGRVRREIESSDARVEASADLRRGVQARQALAQQSLEVARHGLRLMQIRFADGVATRLETAEASAQVREIEAEMPPLDGDRARLVNALSHLLGEPPRALEHELQAIAPIPPVPASVPPGLPSELVQRRPDIREAEARLHAATAEIGVAVGEFCPRITFSASLGVQATHFGDLDDWRSRMFGVGPALSVPIFEVGA